MSKLMGLKDTDGSATRRVPFDPDRHSAVVLPGRGSPSTELSVSERMPDGSIANIPSLWWEDLAGGGAKEFSAEESVRRAAEFEKETATGFPRFGSFDEAVTAAKKRSKRGGAKKKKSYRAQE